MQLALGGLVPKAAWKCHYPFMAGVPPVKHEAHEMPLGQVGLKANEKQELRLSFLAPGRMRVCAACTQPRCCRVLVVPLEAPSSDGVLQFMWLFIISI